ncbi:DUF732 domain-containing protein [Pseudonocardia sp. CA-107938]|uniref:DUF732 domain-containing protein n=1 Tax=Pseudonocardia sp. CA-107938 TaxID=3240021 RepID=UPI003D8D894C
MDDEQVNGRRSARHGAAASQESVITEERPDVSSGHDMGPGIEPGIGPESGTDSGVERGFEHGVEHGVEHGDGPASVLDRHARRRLAAEAAADAAEAAAAEAASRAAAAIKAAARAAEEAEAAADAAARAADEALAAAEAEARANAVHRSVPAAPPAPPTVRAANGHAVNGHSTDGRPDGEPSRPPHPGEQDETTVIATVRAGGRRHRRTADEPVGEAGPAAPEQPAEMTAVVPTTRERVDPRSPDGRAARRRAQEAAAAVAREASRDPVTDAIDVTELRAAGLHSGGPRVQDAATQIVPGRPRSDYEEFDEYGRDDFDGFDPPYDAPYDRDDPAAKRRRSALVESDEDGEEEGGATWFGRPVIYAVGGVLVIIGLIVALIMVLGGGRSTPAPAAGAGDQPAAPTAAAPTGAANGVDPTSPKAVAFLDSLREGGITTSKSGVSETQAAAGICTQISQGADEANLAKTLPTQLPTVAKKQASLFVQLVQKNYC